MFSKKEVKLLLLESLLIVIALYTLIFLATDWLDQERITDLESKLYESSLKQESRNVMDNYFQTLGDDNCRVMKESIQEEYEFVKDFQTDVTRYVMTGLGRNEPYYSIKKREYTLNQLNLLVKTNRYNEVCEETIYPVIYFTEGEDTGIDTQGLILEQFYEDTDDIIILIFDNNYEDEELLNELRKFYSVDRAPFIIFNNKTTREFTNNEVVNLRTLKEEYNKVKEEG